MLDKILYIFALIVVIVISATTVSTLFWIIYLSIKYGPPSVRQNGGLPSKKDKKGKIKNKKTECHK